MIDPDVAYIFVDGSSYPNTSPPSGKGGWAFVALFGSRTDERSGHIPLSTNQIAELTAILKALEFVNPSYRGKVRVVTDSEYARNCITKWVKGWRRGGWRNSVGKPVANRELIELAARKLEFLKACMDIELIWTKGHAKGNTPYSVFNERADVLAGDARKRGILLTDKEA